MKRQVKSLIVSLFLMAPIGSVYCIDPIPLSNADAVMGVITLNITGNYQAIEDLIYPIVIDVNNVSINLNHHRVTSSVATDSIVTINPFLQEIAIFNGRIDNSSPVLGSGSGVVVGSGASSVSVHNLRIFNCGTGVRLAGQSMFHIAEVELEGLDIVGSATGILLEYTDETVIKKCSAVQSSQAGFTLRNSEANCLYECQALTTTGTRTVAAFVSDSGQCNLFQQCVAQQTKTSSTTYGDTANGFLLTGTETKTKILDCIVGETDVLSTPTALTYGIHIQSTLVPVSELLIPLGSLVDFASSSLAWSSDAHFIAGVGAGLLMIGSFDGTNLVTLASISLLNIGFSVGWSPDGKYVAVVDLEGRLYVYSFDGATLVQQALAIPGENGFALAWSPNGKYIVIGDKDVDPAYVRIYSFDGTFLTQVSALSVPGSGDLVSFKSFSWSPDGTYLAAIYGLALGQSTAVIYAFDGKNLTDVGNVIASSSSDIFHDIAWSPDGKYIALAKSNYISVYNLTSLVYPPAVTVATTYPPGKICWAPDGTYLAVCESGDGDAYLRVWRFNGDAMTLAELKSQNASSLNGLSWSPDGAFIASGSNVGLTMYSAMYGPANCLIDNCRVCDTHALSVAMGRGIVGAGSNIFTRNISKNNGVNYCYGIPNVYYGRFDVARADVQPFDNISLPTVL